MGLRSLVIVFAAVWLLGTSQVAEAIWLHNIDCNNCHKTGSTYTTLDGNNVCLSCHSKPTLSIKFNADPLPDHKPDAGFDLGDASNALGSIPPAVTPQKQTSHFWAAKTDVKPAAGAEKPQAIVFYSRFGTSVGKVTCTRCHNPHGEQATQSQLLKLATAEAMCRDCHRSWNTPTGTDGYLSHPLPLGTYASYVNDGTGRFQHIPAFDPGSASSAALLPDGTMGCTSCHGAHFADSDAATADGPLSTQLGEGDGHLLRGDGPNSTGGTQAETAQRRSTLCQSCHTYGMHGKAGAEPNNDGDALDEFVGCLDCHSGHSFDLLDPTHPNFFVLRNSVTTAGFGAKAIDYKNPAIDMETYCTTCHGAVSGFPQTLRTHTPGEGCVGCHAHNAIAYSFAMGDNAAICGDCHGAPPRDNTLAVRGDLLIETGVAVGIDVNYNQDASAKDETATPHKRHAGALNADAASVDYAFGSSGAGLGSACTPCHNDQADTLTPTHDTGISTGSFRDVDFNNFSTYNGLLSGQSYNASWECSNVYCHSNGGKRNASGTKVIGDFKTTLTPSWDLGSNNTTNIGTIVGTGNECRTCHGDTVATMGGVQKGNSLSHATHLTKLGDARTTCYLCHSATVDAGGVVPATARDIRNGGTHVNGVPNVVFDATAYSANLATGTYTGGAVGTCAVYCHNPSTIDSVSGSPDWDIYTGTPLACDACHEGTSVSTVKISTGNHTVHVFAATGPQLTCATCHGTGADTGVNSGHVDGATFVVAGICDSCHGWDAGEKVPAWGETPYVDPDPVKRNEYCIACHTGSTLSIVGGVPAPDKTAALTTGHNRTGVNYLVSESAAAAQYCDSCHDVTAIEHFDGLANNKRLTFPSYAGNENALCGTCHATLVTHQARTCVACHDPHGDDSGNDNIMMVRGDSPDYSGTVRFKMLGDKLLPLSATDSYDEDDDGIAGFLAASEVNGDDICATCHTNVGSLTLHNNQQGTDATAANAGHKLGENCFSCHLAHTDANAFGVGGGDSCESCHGAGAGNDIGSQAIHQVHAKLIPTMDDDSSDCAYCHTSAGSYTYTPGGTHSNAAQRVIDLTASVGYNSTDKTCSTACHASSVADGAWTDVNGLNCNACHGPTADGRPADAMHTAHVVNGGKGCTDCHTVDAPGAGPLSHIDNFDDSGAADDGAAIVDKASATADEATVTRLGMTFNDVPETLNTCSGGIGLGCHATGSPDWDDSTTGDNCVDCHTDTTTSTVNPTSGLHGGTLTVTGNNHDASFDNGNLGLAVCESCHTATPSASHRDGVFNATIGAGGNTAINFVTGANGITFADAAIPTCLPQGTLSTCHSDGGAWSRKWDTTARNSNGTECVNCHGTWGNWATGVLHRTNVETQTKHGTGSYQCKDCHALQSAAGYVFISGSADWGAPNYEISNHGDGSLDINTFNSAFGRDGGVLSGCSTCHASYDGTADGHYSFTTTSWAISAVPTGDEIVSLCSDCHGGTAYNFDAKNYWPDGANDIDLTYTSKDNSGEHEPHILQLARAVYPNDALVDDATTITKLLTNNTAAYPLLTSEQKQTELCSYCHTNPGVNPGHNDNGLPAEVSNMSNLWNKALDDGSYLAIDGTCATSNCHNNKTTPAANGWYDGSASSCAICHDNGAADNTHQDHLAASGAFGIVMDCSACHEGATTTTTAPANNHIDGTFKVDQGTYIDGTTYQYTGYTYPGVQGTCGTNRCHEDGAGGAPYNANTGGYLWSDDGLDDCTICHNNPNTVAQTGNSGTRHTQHMGSSLGYACGDCHSAANLGSHIDDTTDFGGTSHLNYATAPGCTNDCHLADTARGDWIDVDPLACTDCHNSAGGTYVGDNSKYPTSGLHNIVPNITGIQHGAVMGCAACHSTLPAAGGTHIDTFFTGGFGDLTAMGLPVSKYAQTSDNEGTCVNSGCHVAAVGGTSDDWAHVWTDTLNFYIDNKLSCRGCHGDESNNFNGGVIHRGNLNLWAKHGTGTTYKCRDCHALEALSNVYDFAIPGTDWGGISEHGNGTIEISDATISYNETDGTCAPCHPTVSGTYSAANTGWNIVSVTGDPVASNCGECHTAGGVSPISASGAHAAHNAGSAALGDDDGGTACVPCHGDNGGLGFYSETDGTHGDTLGVNFANVSYSQAAMRGNEDGTCLTASCHNKDTGSDPSESWNTLGDLACDDCHYHAATPTALGNSGHAAPLSDDHGVHFGTGGTFVCTDCHGTVTDYTHIDGGAATAIDRANALQNESTVTVDTWNDTADSCANATCHDPSGLGGYAAVWMVSTSAGPNCALCHADTAGDPGTNRHTAHRGAAATYGLPVACADCHTLPVTANHRDGTKDVNGSKIAAWTTNCTTSCHADLAVAPTGDSPDWTTAPGAGCSTCHSNSPISGDHPVHISATQGPVTGINCGNCHAADTVNTTMTGQTTHIDGFVTFKDANILSATNACDICHGGASDANIARTNWGTASGVSCESCHDATPATIGIQAPERATNFLSVGHGLTTGNAPNLACVNCHNETSAHINGGPGDNRLDLSPTSSYNFESAGQENSFCNDCHTTAGAMSVHYDNAFKTGANDTSDDAVYCYVCHDPHGQSGFDAMIRDSIAGRTVVGFTSRTVLASYVTAAPAAGNYGVCQVCHAGEVPYYNQTTSSTTHTTTAPCTDCHFHDAGIAFEKDAAGCTACHGDGASNTWPDDSTSHEANDDGAHTAHVTAIAVHTGDPNTSCSYCHPNNGTHSIDTDYPADVCNDGSNTTKFKTLIGAAVDLLGTYDPAAKTCSNIACHATSPYTPAWYGDSVAPGAVSTFAAATGGASPPGTVFLTWKASGDDGSLDGTAYEYEVRYSENLGDLSATNFDNDPLGKTYPRAGGVPAVSRKSDIAVTQMLVDGLTPEKPYYFATRVWDEAGNVSPVVTSTQVAAQTDSVAPSFYGIEKATASDETGKVNLTWLAARDHSLPITYRVWWSTYPPQYHEDHGAALPTIKTCYNEGTPPTVAVCDDPPTFDYAIDTGTTGGLHYQVSGLTPNVLYNLLARATDSAKTYPGNTPTPNTDSNRFQKMALPITTPVMPTTMPRYYASGTSNLLKDAPGSQATGTTTIDVGQTFTWTSTTGLSATDATEEGGITFEVYIASASRVSESFDYLLGYANSSGVWQEALGLGTAKSLTVGKKAAKVFKIPLGEFHGTVPAGGNRLALRVQNASNAIIFSWGGTNKGVMTVTERNVNVVPTKPTVTTPSDPDADGIYEITWSPSVDGNSHPIHYDAYGSIDGGASYPYVIATDVCFDGSTYDPDCTPASGDETLDGLPWDTIGEGIGIPDMNGASSPANTVKVRVAAGDGYSHNEGLSATFQVDNTADNLAPARVETELALDGITVLRQGLIAEARPKQGSVSLSWTAVGNDGLNHGSRAFEYDIRYSPSSILGGDTTGEAPATITNFNNATEAHGEPFTTFSGMLESYELLGLQPGSSYYVAMRVGDESGNWSPVSNEVVVQGGPKCGICHSTPPDEPNTAGTHVKHGYTIDDCVKCHGDQVQSFALDHQDGQLLLGFGKNGDGSRMAPVEKVPGIEPTVRYIQNGFTIYEDTDGSGGFQGTGGTDSGSCSSFVGVNATGCHGSYSPTWGDTREAQCADCHGDLNRLTDPYTRDFDATIDNGMVVPDQVKASPPIDNHGYDGTGATEGERKYVGAHLVHLNASFRYAKGDNCKLCHDGYNHADGTTDIKFSLSAGDTAQWNEGTATTAGSCSGTSTEGCHGPRLPAEDPKWDSGLDITCDACHDMIAIKAVNGGIVPHTKGKGGAQVECNYCHFEGHPQNGSTNLILVPNNPTVGIAYKSGGIHLKASPGVPDLTADYGPYTYEAELCWGCHDDNGISEWGADDAPLNTATGESPYDYGNVGGVTSSWVSDLGVGATWESAKFGYKTGKIQSTHTVNPAGSSKLKAGGSNYGYFEDPDLPNRIVCSYCHDVHDMNKLAGDTTSGAPYLRGSWLANPYEEDGAPQSGQTYLAGNLYGAVPRAGTQYMQLGGYFIDQNNVVPGTATLTSNGTPDPSPTDGMTLTDTAGLCVVCHGSNVDEMDQEPGENLWLADGVHGYTSSDGQSSYWNGHSNSAIGGTAKYRSNIFDYRHGRPVPVNPTDDTKAVTTEVPSMGWQSIWEGPTTADDYAYGYRGAVSTPYYLPNAGSKAKSYSVYNWGAAVDATTTDSMFHAFSCSKCHNPHASRLPKLMITNCLDIKKNVWDNDKAVQNQWTAHQSGSRYDYGKPTAYYASAQNCHRYDDQFVPGTNGSGQAEMSGGWNKVTPWTTAP